MFYQSSSQLVDAYKALIEIVKEQPNPHIDGPPHAPKSRAFLEDYLDEAPNSAKQIEMRKRILDGSRRSLEKQSVSIQSMVEFSS